MHSTLQTVIFKSKTHTDYSERSRNLCMDKHTHLHCVQKTGTRYSKLAWSFCQFSANFQNSFTSKISGNL